MLQLNAHGPALRSGHVARHGILEKLSSADARLVTIIAPPGYGKTTLMMQLMADDTRPTAWLSLSQPDNDPAVLITNLTAALRYAGLTDASPEDPTPLTSESALTYGIQNLVAGVAQGGTPGVLMLDSLNALRSRHSRDVVAALLANLPDVLRVVLASRSAIGMPLARFRSQGELVELSIPDLAMGEAEAAQLFESVGVDFSDAAPDTLERTEGWPAGLYLTALALKAGATADSAVPVRGDDIFLADYLREEVLGRLTERRMSFLRRSSILSKLSGPICDFVLETTGSARNLERLEESNLMVVPMDRTRTVYRYHSLLGDFLRSELERLEPDAVAGLHSRAATWLADNGEIELAIEHSMKAGEGDRVADMVAVAGRATFSKGHMETVNSWFDWLEETGTIRDYPNLAAMGAYARCLYGNVGGVERLSAYAFLDDAGELIADDALSPFARVLRSYQVQAGLEASLTDARAARKATGALSGWHHIPMGAEALALMYMGDSAAADAVWTEAMQISESLDAHPFTSLSLAERALIAIGRGEWEDAETMIDRSLEVITRSGLDNYITSALSFTLAARIRTRRGDTENAKSYMGRASAIRPRLTSALPTMALQTLLEMAKSFVELADIGGARQVMREAADLAAIVPRLGILGSEHDGLKERLASLPAGHVGPTSLSNAELRLLPLLVTHLSYPEIGDRLFVSRHTVKTQAMSIYRKLGVSSRTAAVEAARQMGLLSV